MAATRRQLDMVYGLIAFHIFLLAQLHLVQSLTVITDPEVTLRAGREGLLPCTANLSQIFSLQWNKGETYIDAENIITLDLRYNYGEKDGPGYQSGMFDITPNLTLVIKNVTLDDRGKYFCEVSEFGTGTLYRDDTDVTVVAKPGMPEITSGRYSKYGDRYDLTWKEPTETGGTPITQYLLHYSESDTPLDTEVGSTHFTQQLGANLRQFTIHGLNETSWYNLEFTAWNDIGESDPAIMQIKTVEIGDTTEKIPLTTSSLNSAMPVAVQSSNTAVIAGVIVGLTALVIVIIIVTYCYFSKKKSKSKRKANQRGEDPKYETVSHSGVSRQPSRDGAPPNQYQDLPQNESGVNMSQLVGNADPYTDHPPGDYPHGELHEDPYGDPYPDPYPPSDLSDYPDSTFYDEAPPRTDAHITTHGFLPSVTDQSELSEQDETLHSDDDVQVYSSIIV